MSPLKPGIDRSAEASGVEPTQVIAEDQEAATVREGVGIGQKGEPEGTAGIDALDAFLDGKRGEFEPYERETELTRGGMGAILLCSDKALGRPVAVKVMGETIAESGEHRIRFLEEAQVTAQLEHPNIVPVHELGKDAEGNLYLTMKLVKGRSLGQILGEIKGAEAPGVRFEVSGDKQAGDKRAGDGSQESGGKRTGDGGQESGVNGHGGDDIARDTRPRQEANARPQGSTIPSFHHSSIPTLTELLNVFLKICDGMAFAHSKGVIHRDLKPANIMVGEFGEVLVMDWGLAKIVERGTGNAECGVDAQGDGRMADGNSRGEEGAGVRGQVSDSSLRDPYGASGVPPFAFRTPPSDFSVPSTVRSVRMDSDVALTLEGTTAGTPAYMPPEQAEGKIHLLDHRSDIYSLGAILYEILTLESPVEGRSVHELLLKVADGNIVPPRKRAPSRHIPKELSAVVMKAMEKNRRKRYQSVQELSQDIKLFLEGRSVSAREDSFVESAVKLVKRNKPVSLAIGVAAALLIAVISLAFLRVTKAMDRAMQGEQQAKAAQEKQRQTALEASRELALQAVRAAEHGHWAEAEVRADAARKIAPEGPWGAYALGTVAKERKDLETAEKHYQTALKNDPAHKESEAAMAQVLSAIGKVNEAIALLRGEGQIKDWYTLKTAGDTLYGAERYREAEKAYTEALAQLDHPQRVPKDAKDWRSLIAAADALLAGKFYPDAKGAYERAITLMKSAKAVPAEAPELTKGKSKQAGEGLSKLKEQIENARGEAEAWVKCEGFYESIQSLSAGEQCARIEAKFKEVHGKHVTGDPKFEDGVLRGITLHSGTRYLQPLKGVALRSLQLSGTRVRNLSPLQGMPLTTLELSGTRVSDLTPLRGMPLTDSVLSVVSGRHYR